MDHSDTLPPDGIPQDVWDAAEDAFDTVLCNDIQASGSSAQFRIDSIAPVARAIMAERERCAKVAEDHGAARKQQYLGATTHKAHKEARDYQSMSMAAYQVAADIRGGQS